MKILIVDDSKAMRSIIMRTLRQVGFENHQYAEAGNGLEALRETRRDCPELILADWNMPQMSGLELLKAFRAENWEPRFGFVTIENGAEVYKTAIEAGADFLLTKPVSPDALERALQRAFAKPRKPPEG